FQIGDIHQANKMDTLVIEAGPPTTLRAFPIALEKLLAVVTKHVVLARHKVDLLRGRSFQYLVERIELTWLRELTQITGVDDEVRCVVHGIVFFVRGLQSSGDSRISGLVKTDVTVADLNKAEIPALAGPFVAAFGECPRHRNAAAHGPQQPCA